MCITTPTNLFPWRCKQQPKQRPQKLAISHQSGEWHRDQSWWSLWRTPTPKLFGRAPTMTHGSLMEEMEKACAATNWHHCFMWFYFTEADLVTAISFWNRLAWMFASVSEMFRMIAISLDHPEIIPSTTVTITKKHTTITVNQNHSTSNIHEYEQKINILMLCMSCSKRFLCFPLNFNSGSYQVKQLFFLNLKCKCISTEH